MFTTTTASGTSSGVNFPDTASGQAFTSIGYTGASYYTAVLTGYINLPAGVANFSTKSDDGSVLFIDGNNTPVVNNNAYQGETAKSGSTGTLSAGLHAIEIAYYQGTGNAGLTAYSDLTETNLLANSQLFCYPAATAYANAVNVTNNSTLDLSVVGAGQAVSFGGLTLGSSNGYGALKITGGSNNAVTFTGSNVVTARGNSSISLGSGTQTLTLAGSQISVIGAQDKLTLPAVTLGSATFNAVSVNGTGDRRYPGALGPDHARRRFRVSVEHQCRRRPGQQHAAYQRLGQRPGVGRHPGRHGDDQP